MKPNKSQINQIKTAFQQMQNRYDFLNLLNLAKPMVYGEEAVPFKLSQVTWYSNPNLGGKRYREFVIKKKSGAERKLHAPVPGLKSLQKTLGFILQCVFEPHKSAMGFVRGKSIVDNARIHVGNIYVYNIDLKDFFSGIDQGRVWKCFQLSPFQLNASTSVTPDWMTWTDFKREYLGTTDAIPFLERTPGIRFATPQGIVEAAKNLDSEKEMFIYSDHGPINDGDENPGERELFLVNRIPDKGRLDIAGMIAAICCTEMEVERRDEEGQWIKVKKNVLPQGAPTSPVITNIVCQRLDFLLNGVAKRFGLRYSRYADDITFSSQHNVYEAESNFQKELRRIIAEQGFHTNESKTRLQKEGYRQEVTGLLVNEKVNVQRRYIKQLRMWLYYWESYGYNRAQRYFMTQYKADKGYIKKGKPDLAYVIAGKLDYLNMVMGNENKMSLKLKDRYTRLTKKEIIDGQNTPLPNKFGIPLDGQMEKRVLVLEDPQYHKVQVLIESIDPENIAAILKRQIIIEKGQVIPYKKIVDNQDSSSDDVESIKAWNTTNDEIQPAIKLPIFHNPQALVSILKKFSVNNSALKYSTHSWDAGQDEEVFKDLEDFLSKAKTEFNQFGDSLQHLNKQLWAKILSFLFNKKIKDSGWGIHRIKFGWSSPELLDEMKKDYEIRPENFVIPNYAQQQIKTSKKTLTIQKFSQVIDLFKNEIEIRDENSVLLELILEFHDRHLNGFEIKNCTNLENKNFYTDVDYLRKALNLVFENIKKRPYHREVSYSLFENNDSYLLEILHLNSFANGRSIYDEKFSLLNGDFGTIKSQLKNLCDWSIESEFKEGCFRINFLTSDSSGIAYEKIEKSAGFKQLFKFYK